MHVHSAPTGGSTTRTKIHEAEMSRSSKVKADEFAVLITNLRGWTIPTTAIDRVHDAARASLNEVKALTEYEDGKVSRLLTVIAFLSAVVGAVFTRFAAVYSWPGFSKFMPSCEWFFPALTYLSFFAYVVLVTWSVWKVIGAIRPIFKIPETWTGPGKTGLPTSMIFYKGMLDVTAPNWGAAFQSLAGNTGEDLKQYYAKCYIAEAYLVAEKVADKLEALGPGIRALRISMGILIFFFIACGATFLFV